MNVNANANANSSGNRRQSKLKRRRRATNNSLSQFAAGGGNASNSNHDNASTSTSTTTRVPTSAGDRDRKLSSKMNKSTGTIGTGKVNSFAHGADTDDNTHTYSYTRTTATHGNGSGNSGMICNADEVADDNQNSTHQTGFDTFSSSSNVIMEMESYPSVSNILNLTSELGSDVYTRQQYDSPNSIQNHNCSDRDRDGLVMGMGRKRLSDEMDWFIENSIRMTMGRKQQVRNTHRRNHNQARMSCISGSIHHSILGTIILNHDHDQDENDDGDDSDEDSMKECDMEGRDKGTSPQSTSFQYVSPLAFPSLTKTKTQSKSKSKSKSRMDRPKWHHDELYHRGDGAVITCTRTSKDKHEEDEKGSSTLLSFPMVGSKTKRAQAGINSTSRKTTRGSTIKAPIVQVQVQAEGMIKIISKNGATLRQDYSIDEDQQAIGKLPFGAVRIYVDSKWLPPPPTPPLPSSRIVGVDDQSCGSDDDDDADLEDTVLVGVMRYKVHLLPLDITDGKDHHIHVDNHMNVGTSTPLQFGWISDRSRLEDDPYVIGEIQK